MCWKAVLLTSPTCLRNKSRARVQYNNNPWNLEGEKTTLTDLFQLWLEYYESAAGA